MEGRGLPFTGNGKHNESERGGEEREREEKERGGQRDVCS